MKTNTSLLCKALPRKLVPVVAALPLLCLAGGGAAHAGSSTQTQTIGPTNTDFSTSTAFNLFNPALGTLTEVDWTVAINGTVTGTITNNATSTQSFNIKEETDFTATGPNTSAVNTNPLMTAQAYSNMASGATSAFGPFTPSSSASTTVTGSGLANYVGNGAFNFGFSTLTGTTILGGGGNVSANISTNAGATATLTYIYSGAAAPEPGSLALLALPALSAIGLVVRRARRA